VTPPTREELDQAKHLLHRTNRGLTCRMREILQDSGLTFPQALVLKTIKRSDSPPSLAEVANKVHLAPSTVTDIIQRLERNKLLTKEKDPTDARAFRLRITEEARKLVGIAEAKYDSFVLHCIASFDADELRLFMALLEKFSRALQEPMTGEASHH